MRISVDFLENYGDELAYELRLYSAGLKEAMQLHSRLKQRAGLRPDLTGFELETDIDILEGNVAENVAGSWRKICEWMMRKGFEAEELDASQLYSLLDFLESRYGAQGIGELADKIADRPHINLLHFG